MLQSSENDIHAEQRRVLRHMYNQVVQKRNCMFLLQRIVQAHVVERRESTVDEHVHYRNTERRLERHCTEIVRLHEQIDNLQGLLDNVDKLRTNGDLHSIMVSDIANRLLQLRTSSHAERTQRDTVTVQAIKTQAEKVAEMDKSTKVIAEALAHKPTSLSAPPSHALVQEMGHVREKFEAARLVPVAYNSARLLAPPPSYKAPGKQRKYTELVSSV